MLTQYPPQTEISRPFPQIIDHIISHHPHVPTLELDPTLPFPVDRLEPLQRELEEPSSGLPHQLGLDVRGGLQRADERPYTQREACGEVSRSGGLVVQRCVGCDESGSGRGGA